jgi:hypothetical protein
MPVLFQQKIDQSHRPVKNFSTERLVERGLCPAGIIWLWQIRFELRRADIP